MLDKLYKLDDWWRQRRPGHQRPWRHFARCGGIGVDAATVTRWRRPKFCHMWTISSKTRLIRRRRSRRYCSRALSKIPALLLPCCQGTRRQKTAKFTSPGAAGIFWWKLCDRHRPLRAGVQLRRRKGGLPASFPTGEGDQETRLAAAWYLCDGVALVYFREAFKNVDALRLQKEAHMDNLEECTLCQMGMGYLNPLTGDARHGSVEAALKWEMMSMDASFEDDGDRETTVKVEDGFTHYSGVVQLCWFYSGVVVLARRRRRRGWEDSGFGVWQRERGRLFFH